MIVGAFVALFAAVVLSGVAALSGICFYRIGFRDGENEGQRARQRFSGDTSVELIGLAGECVDEALSPLSHTLPWSKPALESAREALERAYKSETEAL